MNAVLAVWMLVFAAEAAYLLCLVCRGHGRDALGHVAGLVGSGLVSLGLLARWPGLTLAGLLVTIVYMASIPLRLGMAGGRRPPTVRRPRYRH